MNVDNQTSFFPIPLRTTGLSGALSIGPRPAADALDEWVDQARNMGVTRVVSLITDNEVDTYQLGNESTALARNAIAFERFPIADFGVPDREALTLFLDRAEDYLRRGEHVHLHCAGGVGRAGMIAASLLCRAGIPAQGATKIVSDARGRSVPETDAQRALIATFAST